jgi:hypothetical protein
MKRLSIILLTAFLCLMPIWGWAATYYVDSASGSDSNNGLSEETAFKTLAKTSSLTLNAGDSILLKYGSEFREALYDNGSGISEESRITWGAYGTPADGLPIINAAQLLDDSAMWSDQGGNVWKAAYSYGSDNVLNGGFENWTGGLPDNWNDPGADITVEDEVVDVQAGLHSVKLTANGDSKCFTQGISGLSTETYYVVEAYFKTAVGARVRLYIAGTGFAKVGSYAEYADWTKTSLVFRTTYATTANLWLWIETSGDIVYADSVTIKNTNGCRIEPTRLFLDRAGQKQAANAGAVDATSCWYFDDSTHDLYVYSPSGNPATSYTSPGVEILSYDDSAIILQDYITFQNIRVIGGANYQYTLSGHDYNIVENCIFEYAGLNGIYHLTYSDSTKAEYNIIRNNTVDRKWTTTENPASGEPHGDGIIFCNSAENNTISGNTIVDFGHDHIGLYGTNASCAGVNNNVIEYNDMSAPISLYCKPFSVVGYENKATGNIVRYNYMHDYSGPAQMASNGNYIYYNIFDTTRSVNGDNFGPALCIYAVENYRAKNLYIYGNCFYNAYDAGIEFDAWSYPIDAITVKNNIFLENDTSGAGLGFYMNEDGAEITNTTFQNNCLYDSGTEDRISDDGTLYTVEEANELLDGFSSNISGNPLFTNPVGGDFTLQAGSPCIDAGTNTGYPNAIGQGSAWPSNVIIESQYGDGLYDIGAIRFPKWGPLL